RHRRRHALHAATGAIADQALQHAPAVVFAALARSWSVVDFLPPVLADVGDEQVAIRAVEGKAPGVAQSVGPNFGPGPCGVDERIVRRDADAAGLPFDVEAQELAQERSPILRVIHRVTRRSAVAHSDVEVTVRSEADLAAVVVRK